MTNRISRLKELLLPLNPEILEIEDDSANHRGHAGVDRLQTETHMIIKIKADFGNIKLVDKHRKLKSLIIKEFDKGLHSVSIEML